MKRIDTGSLTITAKLKASKHARSRSVVIATRKFTIKPGARLAASPLLSRGGQSAIKTPGRKGLRLSLAASAHDAAARTKKTAVSRVVTAAAAALRGR